MKNTKADQKVEFNIKGIELLETRLNQPLQPLNIQTIFNYNISLEQKIIPENKLVNIVTSIDIFQDDKETQLGSLKISCIFEINNLDEFIDKETKQVTLPENALITFNSISISTIRGVMFSQFRGTYLHNAILPIIDPTSFVKNNQ